MIRILYFLLFVFLFCAVSYFAIKLLLFFSLPIKYTYMFLFSFGILFLNSFVTIMYKRKASPQLFFQLFAIMAFMLLVFFILNNII